MSDLNIPDSLIARVESGSGADQQLDANVVEALGWTWRALQTDCYGDHDPDIVRHRWFDARGRQQEYRPPLLTASLDAVAALAEETLPGSKWILQNHGHIEGVWQNGNAVASIVEEGSYSSSMWDHVTVATTAARALLSSVLRALRSLQQKDAAE